MTTPAEELRSAAKEIRRWAGVASYVEGRWKVDVAGPIAAAEWLGPSHDALTATWMQAAHVALWSPAIANLVADLLDNIGKGLEFASGRGPTPLEEQRQRGIYRQELALARAVNGSKR